MMCTKTIGEVAVTTELFRDVHFVHKLLSGKIHWLRCC